MKFRTRLFLTMTGFVVFIVVVSIAVVSYRFRSSTIQQIRAEFEWEHYKVNRFQQFEIQSLIGQAVNVSQDPRLRGSIATGDQPTILRSVTETALNYDYDLFWLLTPDGVVRARGETPLAWGDTLAREPAIRDAMHGYDSGDIWLRNEKLYHIAVAPVRSGNAVIAILLIGHRFDRGFANRFSELTDLELVFLNERQVLSSQTDNLNEMVLTAIKEIAKKPLCQMNRIPQIPVTNHSDSTVAAFVTFPLGKEPHAGALFRLNDVAGAQLATGVVYKSLQPEYLQLYRIQQAIILVGVLAILISIIASFFITKQITRPIEQLVVSSASLGRGNLETPIATQSNDEIGALGKALDEMRLSLLAARSDLIRGERLSTIGQMASGIIHDFKQPITAIYGYIDLLALPGVPDEFRKEHRDAVMKQIDRMLSMINELLDFARGDRKLQKQWIPLWRFIEEIKAPFERECRTRQICIQTKLDWEGELFIDEKKLQRGFENIIRNAVQVLPDGGRVELSAKRENGSVTFAIHDDGPGIPDKVKEHLFDPFVTFGKKDGTGLGLAVAQKVVTEHGGTITVESAVGSGTTFYLKIPYELPKEETV
ncbi:MAG: HAMP domain-containing histidine kinase [bacterium]|nr:HAMP domain-containing histidine kinase [bacterium]